MRKVQNTPLPSLLKAGAKAKLALLLVLVMLLPLCLSGCHGHKQWDAFEIPEEFDTSRQFEITFWAKSDSNKVQTAIYRQAIADFEALYPNIKVTMRVFTDYGRIYSDVITNIATGTTPDVCITYPDHVATYMEGENIIVPLDDLFADERYGLGGSQLRFDGPKQSEIIGKFLSECKIGVNHYAIPYMRSTEACYVNKTLVEKLGFTLPEQLTWDFIWEVAEAAMAKGEDGKYLCNGQSTMIPVLYKSPDNMMIQMLRQLDVDYSLSNGQITIFNEGTSQVLQDLEEPFQKGMIATFQSSGGHYPGDLMNAGQCIFGIDSTAGATWIGSGSPQGGNQTVDYELAVMQLPQYDTENPKMISQGPSLCVFNKEDPQRVLAAWLFTQFLLTNEVQIPYAQTEGYVPVTTKAQNSAEYQDYLSRSGEDNDLYYKGKLDATKLLLANMENTFVTPVFNGSASLRNAAGRLIEEVCIATKQNKAVDGAYVQTLFDKVTAQYHLDQVVQSDAPIENMGALPTESVVLLSAIAGCWVLIGGVAGFQWYRRRKQEKK